MQWTAAVGAARECVCTRLAPPPPLTTTHHSAAAPSSTPTPTGARTFEELPLSAATRAALKEAGYTSLTAIQRAALPHALAGRDILGAAKTGSGKTLCFLIPVSWLTS
jgi:ATP-dependent RNA helicase DDX10/DBP4